MIFIIIMPFLEIGLLALWGMKLFLFATCFAYKLKLPLFLFMIFFKPNKIRCSASFLMYIGTRIMYRILESM